MPNFTAGTSFTDGVTNDVTAAKLNALIADAVPTSSLSLNSTTGTIANFTSSTANITLGTIPTLTSSTANITLGTIPTLTSGTTTGTAATFTSGTITTGVIPTLTSGTTTGTAATFTSGTITTGVIPTLTSTTLITSGTGTAASPAIVPTGDTNTGIFFPAADTIAFSEGGAESMRIDSSGNVLVNTTANDTGAKLEVKQAASGTGFGVQAQGNDNPKIQLRLASGSTGVGGEITSNGGLVLSTSNTERLRIDSSGNVGIGTASPATKLTVSGASGSGSELRIVSTTPNTGGKITLYEGTSACWEINPPIGANGPLTVKDIYNNVERLRITSGGLVLIGATSDGGNEKLRVEGSNDNFITRNVNSSSNAPEGVLIQFTAKAPNNTSQHYLYCSDTGAVRMTIRSNGGIANYQANDVNLSDERIKEGIQPSPSYLDKICSIPVVNFKYKDQTHDDYNLGVIAQQVESVCPELVDSDGFGETPNDGEPLKSIYQTDLQYALMKCIQELKAENDSLKTRIEALEAA